MKMEDDKIRKAIEATIKAREAINSLSIKNTISAFKIMFFQLLKEKRLNRKTCWGIRWLLKEKIKHELIRFGAWLFLGK